MADFIETYSDLRNLLEEDLFDNENRNKLLFTTIKELKNCWPDEDIEELIGQLQDYPWRVKKIYEYLQLDDETLSEEIEKHGFSLIFLDAKTFLSDEEQEDVLSKFYNLAYGSENPKISAIDRVVAGKLKKIQRINKNKEPKTNSEVLISKLNKLPKHYWEILLNEAKEWEIDDRFIKILKSLTKPKSLIKKSDSEYVIDMFNYLIEKSFIHKINSNNKTELTKTLTFNSLTDAFKEYAKKT